ncbi:hypothetical protein CcCBS67573_g04466 [Chytriomyces confervae]|uniref:AAA ATPase AAA+ lid domain-containing protein n=1 Tax=Chytriomyces confervae TaxID=246404 RepID=A0A507FDG9_9FUNG|nr:hypothetical protein CcCBS67573_g04466 [Chytriomyces confervae]
MRRVRTRVAECFLFHALENESELIDLVAEYAREKIPQTKTALAMTLRLIQEDQLKLFKNNPRPARLNLRIMNGSDFPPVQMSVAPAPIVGIFPPLFDARNSHGKFFDAAFSSVRKVSSHLFDAANQRNTAYNEPTKIKETTSSANSIDMYQKPTKSIATMDSATEGVGISPNNRQSMSTLAIICLILLREIDEATRRRFRKKMYIPLPEAEARTSLMNRLLLKQKNSLSPQEIDYIVAKTDGYSGSDIDGLVREAALGPIRRLGSNIMSVSVNDVSPVNLQGFHDALTQVRASVSEKDLEFCLKLDADFGSSSGGRS